MPKFSNEFIFPNKLNDVQHQIMIGGLLGDSGLMKHGGAKYPRMRIERQYLDKPYLEWQFSYFKEFVMYDSLKEYTKYDHRYDTNYKYVSFKTRNIPAFLDYYNNWYGSGTRKVPLNIELTPLILAVWFADDGHVSSGGAHRLRIKLSTQSFGKIGTEMLASKLSDRYKESFHVREIDAYKDQYVIKATTCAANAFCREIEPYIIEMGMSRKSDIWKDNDLINKPKQGHPISRHTDIDTLILSMKDFSVINVFEKLSYDKKYIICYIQKLFDLGFATRYESTDKFNAYRYVLTDSGINFLSKD